MKFFAGMLIGIVLASVVFYFSASLNDSTTKLPQDSTVASTSKPVELPPAEDSKLENAMQPSNTFRFEDNILYFYDGTYGFDPGDGEIASITTDFNYDDDGDFKSASIVVPSGAVLVAIRDNYLWGYYEGEITVKGTDDKIEKLEKIFFVIYKDGRPIEYHYPSLDKKYVRFAGKPIEGTVIFY